MTAGSNIILILVKGQSSQRGEGIDEMMHTIDRHMYTIKVKVYDVRIAQGQAPTSDVVEGDIAGYREFGSAWGYRSE